MSTENNIDNVLNILSKKLQGIDYAFIGSVNLYIQGLKIKVRDIDILTTPDGTKKIDKILSKYRIKEIYYDESLGRNSYRSLYMIDEKEVEVLGNVNNTCRRLDSLDRKIFVEFDRMKLPCISLVDEMDTYKKMGREDKVEMIKKFLA